jgi:hypothetical protein
MVLIVAGILAAFVVYVWVLLKVEAQLNEEGQSLVYPWRVPARRREVLRVDGVLSMSIRRLVSGEDEEAVMATLRRNEDCLEGEGRKHLDRAMDRLGSAAARDCVFDRERRARDLDEAVNELWRARAEFLRGTMG